MENMMNFGFIMIVVAACVTVLGLMVFNRLLNGKF